MAQKVTVAPAGDVDGSPADETVRFGFEGADYAIDLSSTMIRRLTAWNWRSWKA